MSLFLLLLWKRRIRLPIIPLIIPHKFSFISERRKEGLSWHVCECERCQRGCVRHEYGRRAKRRPPTAAMDPFATDPPTFLWRFHLTRHTWSETLAVVNYISVKLNHRESNLDTAKALQRASRQFQRMQRKIEPESHQKLNSFYSQQIKGADRHQGSNWTFIVCNYTFESEFVFKIKTNICLWGQKNKLYLFLYAYVPQDPTGPGNAKGV